MKRVPHGFTLIEIVTVIAIMGVLGTVVTISLMGARVRGRDAQRLATLQQIRVGIDQYAVDHGYYPKTSNTVGAAQWTGLDSTQAAYNATLLTALKPYTSKNSFIDPSGPANGSDAGYIYTSDGLNYVLMSWKRPENMNNFDQAVIPTGHCGTAVDGGCSSGNNSVGFWSHDAANSLW